MFLSFSQVLQCRSQESTIPFNAMWMEGVAAESSRYWSISVPVVSTSVAVGTTSANLFAPGYNVSHPGLHSF